MGPQLFAETVYISEINGAKKVKSNSQVAMNKNSDLAECFSLWVAGEDSVPYSNFSELLELTVSSPASKLILGLPVNIDKANSRRYDVTCTLDGI